MIRQLRDGERAAWDAFAAERGGGFMQSWAWSEFKALEGYDVLRLGLFDGTRLRGGLIAYAYPTPAEASLVSVPDGPLLDWRDARAEADLRALVDAARAWPKASRAVALRLEPRLEDPPAFYASLPRSPVDLVPDETWHVPLEAEDAMLARMKPKGRYNARLAERRGVETSSSSDPADVADFHFILENTARFQDFECEPRSFFVNLAAALMPHSARLHFARWRGVTLAAALTVRHGKMVTYLYGGHLPLFRSVMAGHALQWHILREAAREGYKVYDFYGYIPPGLPGHPYDKFSRFKEKFGGRHVRRAGSRDWFFYDRLAEAVLSAMGQEVR